MVSLYKKDNVSYDEFHPIFVIFPKTFVDTMTGFFLSISIIDVGKKTLDRVSGGFERRTSLSIRRKSTF